MKTKERLGTRLSLRLRYLYILLIFSLINAFSAGAAWAHGDIPILIGYGPYVFIFGIVTACIFSAVNKGNKVFAGITGMFLGFLLAVLLFLPWDIRFFWDDLKLILIGLLIYFIPAILTGIFIGRVFNKFKRTD